MYWWVITLTLAWCAVADIHVTVRWTHRNGTGLDLSAEEFARMAEAHNGPAARVEKRNAITDWDYLWEKGVVYYDIDARTADFRLLQILRLAFNFFEKYTCIRWKRRLPGDPKVKDYVMFSMPPSNIRLCNSAVGKQKGIQYVNLDTICVQSLAQVLHQMTHALGFYHTHNRADRDNYVLVYPYNALPQYRKFFDIYPLSKADPMGFPYEFKSLMQVDGMKFASGSNPTIVSKVPGMLLGNNVALTTQDIAMINTLYAQCQRSCRFSNGECEQKCNERKPGDVYCSCSQGFKINQDHRTCYDFDECSAQNGGCDHFCVTHGNWYRCECKPSYTLTDDGHTCKENNRCLDGTLKCDHECLYNRCICRYGFTLNQDGTTCDDIDECLEYNGGCQQTCFNLIGSFGCECDKGKYLLNDGKTCTDKTCAPPTDVADAAVNCTDNDYREGTLCQYSCNKGYVLKGAQTMRCADRKWSNSAPKCKVVDRCEFDNGGCEQLCWANTWDDVQCSCTAGFKLNPDGTSCKDIEPPIIISCPKDIYTTTVPKKSWSSVTWDLPLFYDNTEAQIVSGPVMQDKIGGVFDIGHHEVSYVIEDTSGNQVSCKFKIKVNDVEKPDMFYCPSARTFETSSARNTIEANWEDPSFWDNSEKEVKVTTDLPANRRIQPRSQVIHYIATDPSGNSVSCEINITVVVKGSGCGQFPFTPKRGYVQCYDLVFGSQCRPKCHSGYDLIQEGAAEYYICAKQRWIPTPRQFTCPEIQTPLRPPRLYYELRYDMDCKGSLSDWETIANAIATKYKTLLCPTMKENCKLSVKMQCERDHILSHVYTTEPLVPPVNDRYLNSLASRVKATAPVYFFYVPIGGILRAPESNSFGEKAVPKIDFACADGDEKNLEKLLCYTPI